MVTLQGSKKPGYTYHHNAEESDFRSRLPAKRKMLCTILLFRARTRDAFQNTRVLENLWKQIAFFTFHKLPRQTFQTNAPKRDFFSVGNQSLLSLTYFKTEASQPLSSSLAFYFGYSKYFLARKVAALLTPLPFSMTSVKRSAETAVSRCPFCLVLSFAVKKHPSGFHQYCREFV